MLKAGLTRKQKDKQDVRSFDYFLWKHLLRWALMSGGLVLGATVVSVVVSESPLTANRPLFSIFQRLFLFNAALVLFEIIIAVVANMIRRRNRDVISLKQRLAEIYLAAIRKSALNPHLEPTTSND